MKPPATLKVGRKRVPVTNLDKVLYPEAGFTKGAVIDYYVRVSATLLPHLKSRPVTLKRYPNGVQRPFFYEKQCPPHRPDWIQTAAVTRDSGGSIDYCLLDGLPALVWAANLANLEVHTFLHRAGAMSRPNFLVFDLDPGPPADLVSCAEVAALLKQAFDGLQLASFPKTSGSKGLQVYVPLNSAATYAQTKPLAATVAQELEARFPERVVARMQKGLRAGRVLVDWSQNDEHKTTVCAYSLRARPRPTVSTPVTWPEVAGAVQAKDARLLTFEPPAVLDRVEREGDLFGLVLTLKQKLPRPEALRDAIRQLRPAPVTVDRRAPGTDPPE